MDFLTKLNLDGFYAHKKPWHSGPSFLIATRLNQINALIQKINAPLNQAPSVAHQSLYHRFSSAYFWQSLATHERYAEANELWQNTHDLIYAEGETLVWFIDYAFPLLEEYLLCALKECQVLSKNAQDSIWQKYLPGFSSYLEGINQLDKQLTVLNLNLHKLKNQTTHATKLKIEKNNDLLKLIARLLDVPCEFESTEQLNINTLIFLKQTHPDSSLILPKIQLDKNAPLITPFESTNAWENLTKRLRELKIKYRVTSPKLNSSNTWYTTLINFNWPSVYQTKIYFLQKALKYASLPILTGLFLTGWLHFRLFGIGVTVWASYPYLSELANKLLTQWQRLDDILLSYSERFFKDFLIDRTEYIEMLERSALWRKNRLASGCHHLSSLDPSLLLRPYEDFQSVLQQKIKDLDTMRPYFWQVWRHESTELINNLIAELTQEQSHLLAHLQIYATDLASRINQSLFFEKVYSLEKLTTFISQFAPNALRLLNRENQAIDRFLGCLTEEINAPLLLRHAMVSPTHFATHCCDVVAINKLIDQITPFIKQTDKLRVIVVLAQLLKQERKMSLDQLENYLAKIATENYSAQKLKEAIQQYLFSTFKGDNDLVKTLCSPTHYKSLTMWLQNKQDNIIQAQKYFQLFLNLSDHQDWGKLPEDYSILNSDDFRNYLILLRLNEDQSLIQLLQHKILTLAPHYSGAPSKICDWLALLWQENCPIELEEIVIDARFSWTFEKIACENGLESLDAFVQDMTKVFPRADHNHRLSRALTHHPNFYLPWHVHTQKALAQLEENGLLLSEAKVAYSKKGLQQWLYQI